MMAACCWPEPRLRWASKAAWTRATLSREKKRVTLGLDVPASAANAQPFRTEGKNGSISWQVLLPIRRGLTALGRSGM